MNEVLELQQLSKGSEVETAGWTLLTTLIGTSTISNSCNK
ncbi:MULTISPECIES: class III lanthipeptide [Bacillus]|uniref:Class III lanthipeptide n=2 Tax=Bacillus mojavensis subgroup TaxID=653388 RepID=A0A9Q4EL10_9BACI|nr:MULTISPECIES: class III lanthipeptide [Bacillus]MBV7321348.1 class III lanthipeptide [Halalkalibacterium halodurans]ARW37997.1 hypothetical protein S101267_00888 [Bacillus amyloliquefaciens]AZV92248.1 hypothetical protein BUN12_4006 [Bacillus amyloliquefaciens]MBJ7572704.1 class III lanthipeptide [Bacillus halotolerans]MBL6010654.1 class III lanthipeptide [Bacillus halotolerans]